MKSPLFIPSFNTSSLDLTSSSILTHIVSTFLSSVSASLNTCTAGEFEIIVPVYIFLSLVYIRQYSPSSVGIIGPPTFVIASVPSDLIDLTINPSVSTCAHKAKASSLSPGTSIMRLPLLESAVSKPISSASFFEYAITSCVKPEGESIFIISLRLFKIYFKSSDII